MKSCSSERIEIRHFSKLILLVKPESLNMDFNYVHKSLAVFASFMWMERVGSIVIINFTFLSSSRGSLVFSFPSVSEMYFDNPSRTKNHSFHVLLV